MRDHIPVRELPVEAQLPILWNWIHRLVIAMLAIVVAGGIAAGLFASIFETRAERHADQEKVNHDNACQFLRITPPQDRLAKLARKAYPDCPPYRGKTPKPTKTPTSHKGAVARSRPQGVGEPTPGGVTSTTASAATGNHVVTQTVTRTNSRSAPATRTRTRTLTSTAGPPGLLPGTLCGLLNCRSG